MQQIKIFFRTYQGLSVSVGILIVCVVGLVLGVVPIGKKGFDTAKDVRSLVTKVNVLQNKIFVLQSIDENEMRNDVQTLLSALPPDKSIGTLFDTIDGLTTKTGVSVDSFTIIKPESVGTASASQLTPVPFTVHFSGTLPQVKAFLAAAISVRRLLHVRSFDVTSPPSTGSAGLVSVTVAMDAFYSPIPKAIGSVTQPITGLTNADSDLIAKISSMQLIQSASVVGLPSASASASKVDPFSL